MSRNTTDAVFRRQTRAFPLRPLSMAVILALSLGALPPGINTAQAQASAQQYDLPAGPLDATLTRIARQAGRVATLDPKLVDGLKAGPVKGELSPEQAFTRALTGTGLEMFITPGGALSVRPAPVADKRGDTTLAPVTVTANEEGESAWGPVSGYIAKRSATGTKTDTPIMETPQSISVVTKDFATAIGATRVAEALGYTAGTEIAGSGTDNRFEWIGLRSFNAYTPGPYLDGLQLLNNNTWAVWQTEPYSLERMEVLRGPASVLYGQMPPGGTINMFSKRPLDEAAREVQLQIGEHQRKQLAVDSTGPLDAEGKWLYRIVALARDGELPVGGMADDRQFIAPSLTWRPSSDTSLTLQATYTNIDAGIYTRARPVYGSLVPTLGGTTISSTRFYGEADFNRFEHEQMTAGYLFEHRLNDTWKLRQNLRYGRMDVNYQDIYPGISFVSVNADPTDPANYRVINRNLFISREKVDAVAVDNQAQADFRLGKTEHTLLLGLDYQRNRYDRINIWTAAAPVDVYNPASILPASIPAPYADMRTTLAQTGLYLQDQVKFGDYWRATLGGRYDRFRIVNDNHLSDAKDTQKDGHATYRAGLVYAHPSGWTPYLSYAESFSPVTTIDPSTGKPFDSETGRQYEAGLRYQSGDGKQRYSAAVFDLKRQNYVSYSTTYTPKQTGEILVRGLELEALLQPINGSNIVLAYTLTPKADVTESENPAEVGKQAMPVSRHRLSLWGDYRFATGFKVGAGARYVGSNRGYGESTPVKVPSYTIYDLLLGYELDRWNLTMNVRNLANKNYIANCDTSGCYYGEPRTIMATLGYRW